MFCRAGICKLPVTRLIQRAAATEEDWGSSSERSKADSQLVHRNCRLHRMRVLSLQSSGEFMDACSRCHGRVSKSADVSNAAKDRPPEANEIQKAWDRLLDSLD